MREAFEKWATKGMSDLHKMIFLDRFENSNKYSNSKTNSQWEAWQAAWEASRNDNH